MLPGHSSEWSLCKKPPDFSVLSFLQPLLQRREWKRTFPTGCLSAEAPAEREIQPITEYLWLSIVGGRVSDRIILSKAILKLSEFTLTNLMLQLLSSLTVEMTQQFKPTCRDSSLTVSMVVASHYVLSWATETGSQQSTVEIIANRRSVSWRHQRSVLML